MFTGVPCVTFIGPDKGGIVCTQNSQGFRNPCFAVNGPRDSKPHVEASRLLPNGQRAPFSTASFSSMSGSITVGFSGHEIKMTQAWEGLSLSTEFKGLMGEKLKWKPVGMGNVHELVDPNQGKKIETYHMNEKGTEGARLDIFVQAEAAFIEMVLALEVALCKFHEKIF